MVCKHELEAYVEYWKKYQQLQENMLKSLINWFGYRVRSFLLLGKQPRIRSFKRKLFNLLSNEMGKYFLYHYKHIRYNETVARALNYFFRAVKFKISPGVAL